MSKRALCLGVALGCTAVVIGLVFCLLPVSADPGDILVDRSTGSDVSDCGTGGANPACYSIKYAVETEAVAGDRVMVAAGTYTEMFTLKPGVPVVSQSGPDQTVIDGENKRGPMVSATSSDVTSTARLEGFEITRGNAGWHGGGVYVSGGASPLISNTWIVSNTAAAGGGIALEDGTSLLLYRSRLERNSGTAIRMGKASATILHSEFLTNTSGGWGGGIRAETNCTLVVSDTLFQGNTAQRGAGILTAYDTNLTLRSSEFYSNTATSDGGGVHLRDGSVFDIRDTTFELNQGGGGALWIGGGAGGASEGSVISNTFRFNRSPGGRGGAITLSESNAVISSNLVYSNSAGLNAGGLYIVNSTGRAVGNTIQHNVAGGGGGGIFVWLESTFEFFDNLIEHNEGKGQGGIGVSDGADVEIISNTIQYNESFVHWGGGIGVGGSTAVISGNHILSNTVHDHGGGGIQLIGGTGLIEIRNNVVEHNIANGGGGMAMAFGSAVVSGNTVRHNTARYFFGGGMTVGDGDAYVVKHNWIAYNNGGGIRAEPAATSIKNNLVHGNTHDQLIMYGNQHITVTNNTFVGDGTDDGITIGDGGSPLLGNNVIAGNARGIYANGPVTPTLVHNNLWNNGTADYQGVAPGTDDILCDPDFVDAAGEDYHLGICSCAVDAGLNAGAPVDDYDGNARPVDGDGDGTATVDIGAYERLTVTTPLPKAGFVPLNLGMVVHCTNTSSDAVAHDWDFGDGLGSCTDVDPVYTYTVPGPYTIVLTATSAFGCQDTHQELVEPHLVPIPKWHKQVYANGVLTDANPVAVCAGDIISVVDQISVTWATDVSYTLTETWSASLALNDWLTSEGSITSGADSLVWQAVSAQAGAWHSLTKAFTVLTGTWETDTISESLWVDGAEPQLADRLLSFEHHHPEIAVSPAVLEASLEPEAATTRTVTITNSGSATLEWLVAENPDVTWLAADPFTGSIAAPGYSPVAVVLDAAGLADGEYTTTLQVASNDPDDPRVDVDVVLTVATGKAYVYLPIVLRSVP